MQNRLLVFGFFVFCLFPVCMAGDMQVMTKKNGDGFEFGLVLTEDFKPMIINGSIAVVIIDKEYLCKNNSFDCFASLEMKKNDGVEWALIHGDWFNTKETTIQAKVHPDDRVEVVQWNSCDHTGKDVLLKASLKEKQYISKYLRLQKKVSLLEQETMKLISSSNNQKIGIETYKSNVDYFRKWAGFFFICTISLAGVVGYLLLCK